MDKVVLPLSGDEGVAWLVARGPAATVVPSWPRSNRQALVAVSRDSPGAEPLFEVVLTRAGLDAVATPAGERRVLYFMPSRTEVASLGPSLAALEYES